MKFRVYIAASVDGYVASRDGSVAWLDSFQADSYGYDHFLSGIDTIVMGRTTYDQALGFGPWPYAGKHVFVLTTRPIQDPPPAVTAWHRSPAELAAHLRATVQDGDVWLLGGPRTIHAFRALGAVDTYEIYVLPVLLGDGIPLFERTATLPSAAAEPSTAPGDRLRLTDHHVFPDGAIELVYEPIRADS